VRQQKQGEESESDSGDDPSPEADEPSMSPEVPSQPLSRRSSNVGRHPHDVYHPSSLPPVSSLSDRREESSAGSSARPPPTLESHDGHTRRYYQDNEVPQIVTLPHSEPSPPTPAPMSAPTLPPLRPASDLQAAQRKRAATVPGKSSRQSAGSGPKVVACNFCRGTFILGKFINPCAHLVFALHSSQDQVRRRSPSMCELRA